MRSILCGGFLILVVTLAVPQETRGQSLVDVAKAEEARRKSVKTPAKTFTNEDLKGPDQHQPAPGAAAPATDPSASPDPAKASPSKPPVDEAAKKDEKYWRDRMAVAQNALARSQVLADALQTRVNALNHDFAATDDPVQRAKVEQNRKTALAELDRTNLDIQKQTKAVDDIGEEARKASVPPGWLR